MHSMTQTLLQETSPDCSHEKWDTRRDSRTLLYLTIITFIAHAAFAFFVSYTALPGESFPLLGNDSRGYAEIARSVLNNGQFFTDAEQILTRRPPLYPLFIAGTMFIFGEYYGLHIVVGLQILLFSLVVALTFRIARFWLTRKQSIVVAALLAIEPATWFTVSVLLSDTLFLSLLMISVYILITPRDLTYRKSALSAFALGLAALTRSIAQFFPLIAIIYIIIAKRSLRARVLNSLVFVTFFVLTLAPWMVWSSLNFGSSAISTDSISVHYNHTLPEYIASRTGEDLKTLRKTTRTDIRLRAINENRSATTIMIEESKRIIFAHPFAYAKFHIIKSLPFFLSDGVRETLVQLHTLNERQPNIGNFILRADFRGLFMAVAYSPTIMIIVLGALAWLSIWASVAFSVFAPSFSFPLPRRVITFCILLILLQAALIGPAATPRHRIPALPIIFLLAVPGFSFLIQKFRLRSKTTVGMVQQ